MGFKEKGFKSIVLGSVDPWIKKTVVMLTSKAVYIIFSCKKLNGPMLSFLPCPANVVLVLQLHSSDGVVLKVSSGVGRIPVSNL